MKVAFELSNKWVAALAAGAIGFGAGQVAATSFPSDGQQMYYSGFLADDAGRPQTGTEDISVALFNAASGGSRLCEASEDGVDLAASVGRFRVALPDACSAAVRDNGDVYAQVTVGATVLPRQKLGASPYAVSARDAQSAVRVAANGVDTAALVDGSVTANKLAVSLTGQLDEHEARIDALETVPQMEDVVFVSWRASISSLTSIETKLPVVPVDDASHLLDIENSRFIAPSAGVYLITGVWNTGNLLDQCGFMLKTRKNETPIGATIAAYQSLAAGKSDNLGASIAHALRLAGGDSLTFYVQSNCDTGDTFGAHLQITRLY